MKILHSPRLFIRLFEYKPFSYFVEPTERTLVKARIPMTGEEYLGNAIFQAIVASSLSALLAMVMHFSGIIMFIQGVNPALLFLTQIIMYSPLIAPILTIVLFYVKLRYSVFSRGRDIDQNIHHATAFIYAMIKSGLQPIDALARLAQYKHLYGAIAEEFGLVVRRVRYFGESLKSALKHIADTTSSKKLRDFIYSFIVATDQSISIGAFFKNKFEEYFEKEKRERVTLTENISIVGEIAIIMVAVAPTLVLATGVSLGVLNPEIINICNLYLLALLPLSALLIILYVKAAFPSPKLTSLTKVTFTLPAIENIEVIETREAREDLDRRERLMLFKEALRDFRVMLFVYPWFYPLISAVAVALYLIFLYLSGTQLIRLAVYSLLAGCVIILVPHEARTRYVLSIEKRVPEFLRSLAETVERESSLIKAIDLVLKSRLGLLGKEMQRIYSTRLGATLRQALLMIEYRTASIVLKRAINLIVAASETTRNMKDILLMAAEDAETYVKLRRDRFLNLVGQLIAAYICFSIYVYVYYTLKNSFVTSFSVVPGFLGGAIFAQVMMQGFIASFILAIFLGIIVGVVTEGSIASGLKHSLTMMLIAIVFLGLEP